MLGLPGIYAFDSVASQELIFALDADVPGDFIGGFLLNAANPSVIQGNPRHSLRTRVRVGGSVIFESYHQARAVWDIAQWVWVYQLGLVTYRFQQNPSPSIPITGRSYVNFISGFPDYWNTYFLPESQADTLIYTSPTPPAASSTPRDPTYIYSAAHLPVWFKLYRDAGQQIRINVEAMMEIPTVASELNDEEPVGETAQTFTGSITAWLIRI